MTVNLDKCIEVWASELAFRNGTLVSWVYPVQNGKKDKAQIESKIKESTRLQGEYEELKIRIENFKTDAPTLSLGQLIVMDEFPLSQIFSRSQEYEKTTRQLVGKGLQTQTDLSCEITVLSNVLKLGFNQVIQRTDKFEREKIMTEKDTWTLGNERVSNLSPDARVELTVTQRVKKVNFTADAVIEGTVVVKFESDITLLGKGKHIKHVVSIGQVFDELKTWNVPRLGLDDIEVSGDKAIISLSGEEVEVLGVNVQAKPANEAAKRLFSQGSNKEDFASQSRQKFSFIGVKGEVEGRVEMHFSNDVKNPGLLLMALEKGVDISATGVEGNLKSTGEVTIFDHKVHVPQVSSNPPAGGESMRQQFFSECRQLQDSAMSPELVNKKN